MSFPKTPHIGNNPNNHINSYLWLRKSYTELEPILRNLSR
uniref:Uncharacterized protein n=1 Tax=Vitis vinifera TaxID=29760 RepID=F6H632_VITVI